MGLRILMDHLPVPGGYLANVDPRDFDRVAAHVPEVMTGAEFIDRFGATSDSVTVVQPDRHYCVRASTAHPVYERRRAEMFRQLALDRTDLAAGARMGVLMYESHASYVRCGLGSPGTDRLVELVRSSGPEGGLYGARITGGGSGGTVAVLGRRDASAGVARIAQQYEEKTGYRPYVFSGSSPGVAAAGAQVVIL
jgi:L-arabinokinase